MVAKVNFEQVKELQAESNKLLSSLANAMKDIAVEDRFESSRQAEPSFESSQQAEHSSPRLGM